MPPIVLQAILSIAGNKISCVQIDFTIILKIKHTYLGKAVLFQYTWFNKPTITLLICPKWCLYILLYAFVATRQKVPEFEMINNCFR